MLEAATAWTSTVFVMDTGAVKPEATASRSTEHNTVMDLILLF